MKPKITDLTYGMKPEAWLEEMFVALLDEPDQLSSYEAFGIVLRLFEPTNLKGKELINEGIHHSVKHYASSFLKEAEEVADMALDEALMLHMPLNMVEQSFHTNPEEAGIMMVPIISAREHLGDVLEVLNLIGKTPKELMSAIKALDDHHSSNPAPMGIIKGVLTEGHLYEILKVVKNKHPDDWWGKFDLLEKAAHT